MEEQDKKTRPTWEVRADQRTADHLVRQFRRIEEDLGDLISDFRTLGRYAEMDCISGILIRLEWMRINSRHFADNGKWPE